MRAITRTTMKQLGAPTVTLWILVLAISMTAGADDATSGPIDVDNVPLDQVDQRPSVGSNATPPDSMLPEVFIFPATGDTRFNQSGTNFWNQGDYVEGTRTFTVATQHMDMVLEIAPNVLSCDTQDHDFMVDGVTIGSFVVSSGDTQVLASFDFAQIDPGLHTLRIETTRTVNPGCGSAGFPNDVSTVDFVEVPVELMSATVE